MESIVIDARGEQCPIPVIKTRKALADNVGAKSFIVHVSEDNAAQNVQRMAITRGFSAIIAKIDDEHYTIAISGEGEATPLTSEEQYMCTPSHLTRNVVVAIGSATMGNGDDKLGKTLMKGYIYALSQQEELPACVLFYNGGAQYTCEGSPSLEDLKSMADRGVEIMTCGTCLDFYGIKDKLAVGQITNMYVIAEKMQKASHLVKP